MLGLRINKFFFSGVKMSDLKNRLNIISNPRFQIAGIIILILLAALLLWFNNSNSNQAMSAMVAQVRFKGEYRIGEGDWQEIVEGQHIS